MRILTDIYWWCVFELRRLRGWNPPYFDKFGGYEKAREALDKKIEEFKKNLELICEEYKKKQEKL